MDMIRAAHNYTSIYIYMNSQISLILCLCASLSPYLCKLYYIMYQKVLQN